VCDQTWDTSLSIRSLWDDLGVRRAAFGAVAVAAVLAGSAFAAQGDPQKKITKAGQARARAASHTLADVGRGWKSEPANKKESNPRCSTYNPDQSDLVEIGDYDSPEFGRSDGTFISSTTGVFKTAAMARTAYARVAVPALPRCFAEIFKKAITKPSSATIFSAGPLTFPKYGDRSNAYRITSSVKTPSGRARATIDLVVFNRGQVDVAIIFVAINQALPASLEQSLVAKVAARAR
jgi:hypothetical protein